MWSSIGLSLSASHLVCNRVRPRRQLAQLVRVARLTQIGRQAAHEERETGAEDERGVDILRRGDDAFLEQVSNLLGQGLPMAPSVLLQMVGQQVAQHVRETLYAAYPDRFAVTGEGAVRSVEEIREAVLEALAEEVRHLLEEGVVASPKDVDTALILGAGFPFFMGGLTPYLRQAGYSYELSKLSSGSDTVAN